MKNITIEQKKDYIENFRYCIDKNLIKKYGIDLMFTFAKNNTTYICEHILREADIEKYLSIQEKFKNRTLKNKNPRVYDNIEVHSSNGHIFFKSAMIDTRLWNKEKFCYVEQASSFYDGDLNSCMSSGGAYNDLDVDKLEYIGTTERTIWTWGSYGACGHGGIYIPVLVNNFKLQIERKYIPFVVKNFKKDEYGYKYSFENWDKNDSCHYSFRTYFKTMSGLKKFLQNRKLKIDKKIMENCHEVIGDFEYVPHSDIKSYEKDRAGLVEFPLLYNGEYIAAFYKNGQVHYCNNCVKERKFLPCLYK